MFDFMIDNLKLEITDISYDLYTNQSHNTVELKSISPNWGNNKLNEGLF